MLTPSEFREDMTYLQTLRIVARGLIQWPLYRHEAAQIREAVKDAAIYLSMPFARILALVLLPVSAPVFTWIVQIERRRVAAAKKKAHQRFVDAQSMARDTLTKAEGEE